MAPNLNSHRGLGCVTSQYRKYDPIQARQKKNIKMKRRSLISYNNVPFNPLSLMKYLSCSIGLLNSLPNMVAPTSVPDTPKQSAISSMPIDRM